MEIKYCIIIIILFVAVAFDNVNGTIVESNNPQNEENVSDRPYNQRKTKETNSDNYASQTTTTFGSVSELPETELITSSSNPNLRSNNDNNGMDSHIDPDRERLKKILDKILSDMPEVNDNLKKSFKHPEQLNPDDRTRSEVKTFVGLIKTQTPMIILGCILSALVLLAVIVTAYLFLKKLNARSTITLIAHYEYDDITGQPMLKELHQQKINHSDDKFIIDKMP